MRANISQIYLTEGNNQQSIRLLFFVPDSVCVQTVCRCCNYVHILTSFWSLWTEWNETKTGRNVYVCVLQTFTVQQKSIFRPYSFLSSEIITIIIFSVFILLLVWKFFGGNISRVRIMIEWEPQSCRLYMNYFKLLLFTYWVSVDAFMSCVNKNVHDDGFKRWVYRWRSCTDWFNICNAKTYILFESACLHITKRIFVI